MNGYIINPAWFYWVNIANAGRAVLSISSVILLLLTSICFFMLADDMLFDEEDRARVKKAIGRGFVVGIFCLIAAIFIPSKETLIEMQVAKYATWENAEWTVDAVKDAVDYIVNAIGSLK